MVDEIFGAVIGGFVAGLAGVITVIAQQWIQNRQSLKEQILGPSYDYLEKFPASPDRYPGADPWRDLPSHNRLKVWRRLRTALDKSAENSDRLTLADAAYNNYVDASVKPEVTPLLRDPLSKMITADGGLPRTLFGENAVGSRSLDFLFDGIHREMARYPENSEVAWSAVILSARSKDWFADGFAKSMENKDPEALKRIHEIFVTSSTFPKAREFLRTADAHRLVEVARAKVLVRALKARFPRIALFIERPEKD